MTGGGKRWFNGLRLSRPTILAFRNSFAKDCIAAVAGIRKRKHRAKVLTPELEQKILDTALKPAQATAARTGVCGC
jgi:hypothetical protein